MKPFPTYNQAEKDVVGTNDYMGVDCFAPMGVYEEWEKRILAWDKETFARARKILGNDFASPGDILKRSHEGFDESYFIGLAESLPSESEMLWLRDHNFVLVAGDPHDREFASRPVSILNNHLRGKFSSGSDIAYCPEHEFTYMDNSHKSVGRHWLAICKDGERSVGKDFYVANISQVMWAFSYAKILHERQSYQAGKFNMSVSRGRLKIDRYRGFSRDHCLFVVGKKIK
jgi:hypothetical protein